MDPDQRQNRGVASLKIKTKIYKKINQAPDEFFKFLEIIFVLILRAKPDQRL